MTHLLSGLVAATYTAFNADGSLNLDPIEKHAELLARNGVSGVFVCGSTGESAAMTTAVLASVAVWPSCASVGAPLTALTLTATWPTSLPPRPSDTV